MDAPAPARYTRHVDLAALLCQANALAERLLRGDLSAAAPLAEIECELAAVAATVGMPATE